MQNYLTILFIVFFFVTHLKAQWLDGALYPDFKVNDDSTTLTQSYPSIGVDGQGNFVITWNDRRNYPTDQMVQVYCQRYNNYAVSEGMNFRIGHDTAGGSNVCVLSNGRFIVSWAGIDNGNRDIYQQRFQNNGIPLNQYQKINDTTVSDGPSIGGAAADSIGNYVIVWIDFRYGFLTPNIYGQRYDSAGNKIGNNFRVNEDSPQNSHWSPSVATNLDGNFIVSWADGRAGSRIYMQRYDRYGIKIGFNQRVDDNPTNTVKGACDIASDGNGYFVISFDDCRYQPNQSLVFFQLYDSTGNKIGVNQRVDEGVGYEAGGAKVTMQNDGKYFILWREIFSTSGVPYGQRYRKDGSKIGNNFQIPVNSNFSDANLGGAVLLNDRMYSTWADTRNINWDIFANIRSFINPDSTLSGVESNHINSYEFKLFSAFPNPFNPVTIINYHLPITNYVKLSVIDILGREIEVLVNDKQKRGSYKVVWDGSGCSSGIYFVRLVTESGFRASQKLILLK